jgi:hypothetical protein
VGKTIVDMRRTRMNRRGLWAACVVLLVGVGVVAVGAGYAEDENDAGTKCSEATLHGTYLIAHNGVVIEETKAGLPQGPFAQAGYEVYDGNGNVDGLVSLNFNGNVFRHVSVPGTYTVKANCTGTSTFISEEGVPFRADLFIAPDGSMYTFVQTNPREVVAAGFELQGTAKRIGD